MYEFRNASADECADYTITLFSDYTRKVTLQNLFHDGGFSNVGVSQEIIDAFWELIEKTKGHLCKDFSFTKHQNNLCGFSINSFIHYF